MAKSSKRSDKISFNKTLVIILLILLPVIGFFFGKIYQENNVNDASGKSDSADLTQGWKLHNNNEYFFSFKYPDDLYVREYPNSASFAYEEFPTDTSLPGPKENINYTIDSYYKDSFDAVSLADTGEEVPEATNASDTKAFKVSNRKIGIYNSVEYIRDGINYQTSGLGRGYIGYEHIIIIKINDNTFLQFVNTTDSKEKTEERDVIFNQMIDSLTFK